MNEARIGSCHLIAGKLPQRAHRDLHGEGFEFLAEALDVALEVLREELPGLDDETLRRASSHVVVAVRPALAMATGCEVYHS